MLSAILPRPDCCPSLHLPAAPKPWRGVRAWAAAMLGLALAAGAPAVRADAEQLRNQYTALRDALRNNDFQRPLHIVSSEGEGGSLQGDVYAVLEHPFARVQQGLGEAAQWCDILILPFNTQYCRPAEGAGPQGLDVRIGRKPDSPIDQAYRLNFSWQPVAAGPDYLEARLSAPSGPLGTRDYRIAVSAMPLGAGRSFMHLHYAYASGVAGRLAMQAYLATAGSDKVGFSVAGRGADGKPNYIGGARGAIERNAMRYYLAIDACLDALAAPEAQRTDRRIQTWFDATERYPQQLHEMDKATYVALKRQQYARQQSRLD